MKKLLSATIIIASAFVSSAAFAATPTTIVATGSQTINFPGSVNYCAGPIDVALGKTTEKYIFQDFIERVYSDFVNTQSDSIDMSNYILMKADQHIADDISASNTKIANCQKATNLAYKNKQVTKASALKILSATKNISGYVALMKSSVASAKIAVQKLNLKKEYRGDDTKKLFSVHEKYAKSVLKGYTQSQYLYTRIYNILLAQKIQKELYTGDVHGSLSDVLNQLK